MIDANKIEFIKYGKCTSCGDDTCFLYVGRQEFGKLHINSPLYNCHSCGTTTTLRGIVQKVSEAKNCFEKDRS